MFQMNQKSLLELLNDRDDVALYGREPLTYIKNSPYTDDKSLIDIVKHNPHNFFILSMNCQSLNAKFNEILVYLQFLHNEGFDFDVICLQETWLEDKIQGGFYDLPGYNAIHQGKTCSAHGGLSIYLKEHIRYNIINTESFTSWENQFIEIPGVGHNKKITIGNIYRPPRDRNEDYNSFITEFSSILTQCRIIVVS